MISPDTLKLIGYLLSSASVALLLWVAIPNALTTLTGTWAMITGVSLSMLGMFFHYLAFLRIKQKGSK